MIIRIVKMTFDPSCVSEFLTIFAHSKGKIRAMDGCEHLELLNDINQKNVFFTYSHWQSQEDLSKYRQSELFKTTWEKTKQLFIDKPKAWSVKKVTMATN